MSEPRWLSDEEQRTWRAYLAATRAVWDHLGGQLERDAGMPHSYYMILAGLSESPGRSMRMSDLAEWTCSTRSALSHAVARLEQLGWVRREPVPDDRRGQFALLTDEGFAVLVAAAPNHVEAVRQALFDPLTPEQVEQLRAICDAVVVAIPLVSAR